MACDDDLDDANHYEIIHGMRVQLPPRSVHSGLVTSHLLGALSVHGIAHNIGEPIAYCLMRLPHASDPYCCRRPDISFVSFNRWPANRPMSKTAEAWDVVPDLAVQVISPNDSATDLVTKIGEYFDAGVRLVWIVYPTFQTIYVYHAPNQVRIMSGSDTLDGGTVLPGFQLRLDRLFDPIAPPTEAT